MKINSSFVDFYDYVTGIVGIDNDRTFFRVTQDMYPVDESLKAMATSVLQKCKSGYLTSDFKVKKDDLIRFRKNYAPDSIKPENPSKLSEYISHMHSSLVLHRLYRMSAEVFMSHDYCGGSKIYPCALIFGSKIGLGFVISTHAFNDDGSSGKSFETIMTINKLSTVLVGHAFNKMRGNPAYESLVAYVDYLVHAGAFNGLDIDGEVPFGEFQDVLGDSDVLNYNRLISAPTSLILYSGIRKIIKNHRHETISSYYASANDEIHCNNIVGIVKNPILISSGLQMLMCPMQAYQDIDMAVSEINNVEKEAHFTDKIMIESKGFDSKTSFRKRKSKKQVD